MKNLKYYLVMVLIVLIELGTGFLLFKFVLASKVWYVLLSILIFGSIAFYLNYSKYRELIKMNDKAIVQKGYIRVFRNTILVIVIAVLILIVVKAGYAFIASLL